MKRFKILGLVLLMVLFSGCGKDMEDIETLEGIRYYETDKKTNNVVIELEDDRKILIELYPDIAPKTVKNFQNLVSKDFYDDVIFHRVIKDFMIQTGDASSLGRSAKNIEGEFKDNNIENNLSHTRGVVSMARANDYNSASSQFFIVHKDSTYLDGKYAAFGKVLAGMDVVDSIASVVTDSNDKPLKDIVIDEIYFVKVVD